MADNDLIIEYYIDEMNVWAFIIGKQTIQVYSLDISSADLDKLISKLQANTDWALGLAPDEALCQKLTIHYQQISSRLYEGLIKFVEGRLSDDTRLIFVPYGVLHYVPFNALFDGQHYLIEKHEVVLMPSSALMTRKSHSRAKGARVLAHSWDGRLPNTLVEARHVIDLLGGELHSEQDAYRHHMKATPLQVLHIAAHGEYRIDIPELSYIQLEDGQAYVDDFLQEDLGYELITLSGCDTGRANVSSGDELVGLGRGFLYAGAGAIVASLWRVEDKLTTELMAQFYERLANGRSKSCALQFAQHELLNRYSQLHPAYWGALQLIGDPGPLMNVDISH